MDRTTTSPALSIGAVLGDSDTESMAWKRSISELGKQVILLREGRSSPLNLNAVFHVDGKSAPNDFIGVRTGRFSKATSHLMVQAAVPPGPVADRRDVLLRLLSEAVSGAESFARRRHIADELTAIQAILADLKVLT
ncbi:MAG: hypothetical protein ACTHNQ_05200 [Microbacterium sp.]|uniref:hypothetical protein n=1 Tax=Microbacterium sp. TaxID=51671 RepID=UPI003F817E2F